jgi:hypothetical protein
MPIERPGVRDEEVDLEPGESLSTAAASRTSTTTLVAPSRFPRDALQAGRPARGEDDLAPRPARARAVAAPIPDEAPVTRALRPERGLMTVL